MIRSIVIIAIAALAVFAVVQDRVTGAGVGQYVEMHEAAAAGRRHRATIDDVMTPAVTRGVQQGAIWGGTVFVAGLAGMVAVRRRTRRE